MRFLKTLQVSVGVVALAAMSPANAQSAPTDSFASAFVEQAIFNAPTETSKRVDTYSTQILGVLSTGQTLFDLTFALPFADAIVQASLTDATNALLAGGGLGTTVGSPVLTGGSVTLLNSTGSTTYSLADTAFSVNTVVTFGPAAIQTGQLSACSGISSLPSSTAPVCGPASPQSYAVGDDETNFNTTSTTTYTIDQTRTGTDTYLTSRQYTLTGLVPSAGGGGGVGGVPEPASWAMLIAGFGLVGATARRRRKTEGRTGPSFA